MGSIQENIGENIRNLRKEKKLTLAEMAEMCKCSVSLLSQIETGNVNPSLGAMKAIADALETSLSQLFATGQVVEMGSLPDQAAAEAFAVGGLYHCLMKQGERKILVTEGGSQFELLSRGMSVPFEFILNKWPPKSSTGKNFITHDGYECGLLLEGKLVVEVNGKIYHMEPGDSITILSTLPHRINNPGEKEAVAIWVNSEPWCFSTK